MECRVAERRGIHDAGARTNHFFCEIYERNLDWFRFWLQGEKDRDPDREQYSRWQRLLKDMKRKLSLAVN